MEKWRCHWGKNKSSHLSAGMTPLFRQVAAPKNLFAFAKLFLPSLWYFLTMIKMDEESSDQWSWQLSNVSIGRNRLVLSGDCFAQMRETFPLALRQKQTTTTTTTTTDLTTNNTKTNPLIQCQSSLLLSQLLVYWSMSSERINSLDKHQWTCQTRKLFTFSLFVDLPTICEKSTSTCSWTTEFISSSLTCPEDFCRVWSLIGFVSARTKNGENLKKRTLCSFENARASMEKCLSDLSAM